MKSFKQYVNERRGWDGSFTDYDEWYKTVLSTWGNEVEFQEEMDGLVKAKDGSMAVGSFDMNYNSGQMLKR